MTLPIERTRAVEKAYRFLLDLCNPQVTPKVPLRVRREARAILKHFPNAFNMEEAAKHSPLVFGSLKNEDKSFLDLASVREYFERQTKAKYR